MEKVDVKCGFQCNNMCRFCVQGDKRSKHTPFTFAHLVRTLEFARSDSDAIVLTGGEPTIRADFLDLVRKAAELGFSRIQLQTNGRMFASGTFCDRVISDGVNEFSLALHGHTPDLHEYLTRAPGSFRETARGIRNLKQRGQYVGTNTVITRSNYRHLPDIARVLVHLGVNQYQFAFVHALGSAARHFGSVVPRYGLVEPYVKKGLDYGICRGVTPMTEAIPFCFMRGYADYVAEQIIPRTKIYDVLTIEDYTAYRLSEGKLKGDPCERCAVSSQCEGPWREYSERFGWAEFKPLTAQEVFAAS